MAMPRAMFFTPAPTGDISKGSLESEHISQPQQLISRWIDAHKSSFITHAIWADNIEGAITSGFIEPAESLLRKTGRVSYESGMHRERSVADISQIISSDEHAHLDLPRDVTLKDSMPISDAWKYRFMDDSQYCEFLSQHADAKKDVLYTLNDHKAYQIQYNPVGVDTGLLYNTCFQIKGIPVLHSSYSDYKSTIKKYSHQFGCTEILTQIALDHLAKNPIDTFLAKVWESYQPLILTANYKSLARELNIARQAVIFPSKLNSEIRAEYNSIRWAYGDVVILRGKPEKILSIQNKIQHLSDAECSSIKMKDAEFKQGQEVFLLKPYENGGKFFSLDLRQEDTMVIGPESILTRYRKTAEARDIKLFYIEEMSEEQLNFFCVPDKLRPKKRAALTEAKDAKEDASSVASRRFS